MKTSIMKRLFLIMFWSIFFMMGCSDEPLGLGEALIKTLHPNDGLWSGSTSQEKDISYDVINQGTQIDSGLVITISFNEYWGHGYVIVELLTPTSIKDNTFSWSDYGFSLNGTFESEICTNCRGDFSLSTNTGYPRYLPVSASGTWHANWQSSPHKLSTCGSCSALTKGIELDSIKKLVATNVVKISLYVLK